MLRNTWAFALVCFVTAGPILAGEYNRKVSAGDLAPTWTDLPGVDDRNHSLGDLKDKEVVVVVFTCNQCPVAEDYQDRFIAFAKKHSAAPGSKVALVAISVSLLEADRLPRMKELARKKGFNFPYLYDASQKVGRAYGATVTPEFFVLNKERKIVYLGAFDDDINEAKAKVHYVDDAVQATLKGAKPARVETPARGCSLEYQKK